MPTYTITLTDEEQKGMEYVSTDVGFWIQNAVHERARLAMEEMVADHIKETLASGKSVSGSREEIVMKSNLPSARSRHEEMLRRMVTLQPPTKGEDK